jgi:hypothetical protein
MSENYIFEFDRILSYFVWLSFLLSQIHYIWNEIKGVAIVYGKVNVDISYIIQVIYVFFS